MGQVDYLIMKLKSIPYVIKLHYFYPNFLINEEY